MRQYERDIAKKTINDARQRVSLRNAVIKDLIDSWPVTLITIIMFTTVIGGFIYLFYNDPDPILLAIFFLAVIPTMALFGGIYLFMFNGRVQYTKKILENFTADEVILVIDDPQRGIYLFGERGYFVTSILMFQPYFEKIFAVENIVLDESHIYLKLLLRKGRGHIWFPLKWPYGRNETEGEQALHQLRATVRKAHDRFFQRN